MCHKFLNPVSQKFAKRYRYGGLNLGLNYSIPCASLILINIEMRTITKEFQGPFSLTELISEIGEPISVYVYYLNSQNFKPTIKIEYSDLNI